MNVLAYSGSPPGPFGQVHLSSKQQIVILTLIWRSTHCCGDVELVMMCLVICCFASTPDDAPDRGCAAPE